jgi:outer membrane protein assembly factor BamB
MPSRVGSGVAALLSRLADSAGKRTTIWMTFVVLATIEAVGAVVGPRWPAQAPVVRDWLWRLTDRIGQRSAFPSSSAVDPYQAWVRALLPPSLTWLAYAATAVFLVLLLAVLRQHRHDLVRTRALRLATASLAWLLMVGYLVHLAATRLAPVMVVLASVSFVFLAFVGAGAATIVRYGAGKRPAELAPAPIGGAVRLGRAAVATGAALLLGLALQAFPAPEYRPAITMLADPAITFHALVRDGNAFFAGSTDGAVRVTAVQPATGQVLWTGQLPRSADDRANDFRLTASPQALYVQAIGPDRGGPIQALSIVDGKPLWARDAGVVYGYHNAVLYADPASGSLAGLDELTGAPLWSVALVPGAVVRWPEPLPADVSTVAIVDPAGGVVILNPADGSVIASMAAPGPAAVWLVDDQLVWASGDRPYTLTAFRLAELSQPDWTYTGPDDAAAPSDLVSCGVGMVCVSDGAGVRSLDAGTGTLTWERRDISGDRLAGSADGLVVRSDEGTVVVNPAGGVLGRFAGHDAYPLGEQELLLVGPDADRVDVSIFDTGSARWSRLGSVHMRLATCAWDERYLACAGPTARVWSLR